MSTKKTQARRHAADWELNVYIANWAARSALTVANLERVCEEYVPGRYRIRIVDLRKTPERSREDQIVALPTVIRRQPLPERRIIGTLADSESVAAALELRAERR